MVDVNLIVYLHRFYTFLEALCFIDFMSLVKTKYPNIKFLQNYLFLIR
jgi:hypothetical protein